MHERDSRDFCQTTEENAKALESVMNDVFDTIEHFTGFQTPEINLQLPDCSIIDTEMRVSQMMHAVSDGNMSAADRALLSQNLIDGMGFTLKLGERLSWKDINFAAAQKLFDEVNDRLEAAGNPMRIDLDLDYVRDGQVNPKRAIANLGVYNKDSLQVAWEKEFYVGAGDNATTTKMPPPRPSLSEHPSNPMPPSNESPVMPGYPTNPYQDGQMYNPDSIDAAMDNNPFKIQSDADGLENIKLDFDTIRARLGDDALEELRTMSREDMDSYINSLGVNKEDPLYTALSALRRDRFPLAGLRSAEGDTFVDALRDMSDEDYYQQTQMLREYYTDIDGKVDPDIEAGLRQLSYMRSMNKTLHDSGSGMTIVDE